MLVLSALSLVPVLWPDGSLVRATPLFRPGERLVVSDSHVVTGHEVWGEVVVESTGILTVTDGGRLVADGVLLEGNSVVMLDGGILEVAPVEYRPNATISGTCARFEVVHHSQVRVIGPDGGYDLHTSMGCSVGLDIVVGRNLLLGNCTVELRGGDGMSLPETLTDGDLEGREFSGGDATLSIVQTSYMDMILSEAVLSLKGGNGGDAPDAEVPPGSSGGRLKGLGGGYTRGGNVSGRVGSGGDVRVHLEAHQLEMSGIDLDVSAGNGGDAGDGASVPAGIQAGAGGGGYSGGDGASGLTEELGATAGGRVSGGVGRGGDIDLTLEVSRSTVRTTHITLLGGSGGDAGSGGTSNGLGGAGGGGFSGGGGGSYWHMAGAQGGDLSGEVARGGDVRARIDASEELELLSDGLCLRSGRGGDTGDGGDGGTHGGGGGGGYSGGGGGGSGDTEGDGAGNAGGQGGWVFERVGSGGSSVLELASPVFHEIGSQLHAFGGGGGSYGEPGVTFTLPSGDVAGGGGGGGHTAGGGGGAGQAGQPGGEGGLPGCVGGQVCDGGGANLDIRSERPSIHNNTDVIVEPGPSGVAIDVPPKEATSGRDDGHRASPGRAEEHIPMSVPRLYAPANDETYKKPPRFDWMPVYRSSDHGDVAYYRLELDDDPRFGDLVLEEDVPEPGWTFTHLGMDTYYWRVTAVYEDPGAEGPTSSKYRFELYNVPPQIRSIVPQVECLVGEPRRLNLRYWVSDIDTRPEDLKITCEHPSFISFEWPLMIVVYPEWVPPHELRYNVSDEMSTVTGIIKITVLEKNHWPVIHDIGGRDPSEPIPLFTGEGLYLQVNASDPDGDDLTYTQSSDWGSVSVSELGTLYVLAQVEDIGSQVVHLQVKDDRNGVAWVKLTFLVSKRTEPPGPIEVLAPGNGTRFKEGRTIAITVKVTDPDTEYGEWLNVTWNSNVCGRLGTVCTQEMAELRRSDLPPGTHNITIEVSDGTYERTASLVIIVLPWEEPSEPPDRPMLWLYGLFGLIFVLMVVAGFIAGTRGVRDGT